MKDGKQKNQGMDKNIHSSEPAALQEQAKVHFTSIITSEILTPIDRRTKIFDSRIFKLGNIRMNIY